MLLRTIAFHNKNLISGSVVIRNRPTQFWVGWSPLLKLISIISRLIKLKINRLYDNSRSGTRTPTLKTTMMSARFAKIWSRKPGIHCNPMKLRYYILHFNMIYRNYLYALLLGDKKLRFMWDKCGLVALLTRMNGWVFFNKLYRTTCQTPYIFTLKILARVQICPPPKVFRGGPEAQKKF